MDLSGTQSAPGAAAAIPNLLEYVEQWLARRWVPIVINMVVLALLSFSLARGTWRLITPTVPESPATATGETTGDLNLPALLSSNLFGQLSVTGKTGGVQLESIPLSSLNLVLTGVLISPGGGVALISAEGSPELPFGIGQEIASGVSLYAVYADRALIRRGGATESLMLKDTGAALPDGSILAPAPPQRGRGIERRGTNNFSVDRQQLTQQMQTPDFLSQALMVPNAGGGFLVREIQAGSVYEKLGLKVGDVINSVNGQTVNSVDDVMRLYQQFSSVANVQIDVRRAGRNESLVYSIQ